MVRSSDYPFPISLFKDRTFQAREIRRVMKVSLIYLLATTVLLAVFYQQLLGQLLEGTAPLLFVSEDAALIDEAVPTLGAMLFKWVMAMLVINVLVTAAVGVYIARRLGHPLLALKRSLREIGAGNLDVQLRDSDTGEFAEITHELMTALATVRQRVAAAKSAAEGAHAADGQIALSQAEAEQALHNCKLALDYFQVDTGTSAQRKAA